MYAAALDAHDNAKVDTDPFYFGLRVAVGTVSVPLVDLADPIE